MRSLLLIPFCILSFASIAGEPAKVVGVIPVKFNSKGNHAPLPYSQQMMQRGWASFPARVVPLSGGAPRFNPVRVAKPNLIRTLSRLAHTAGKMFPAGKYLLAAYGAYEANCIDQVVPSLCVGSPFDTSTATIQDGVPANKGTSCTPKTIRAPAPDSRKEVNQADFNAWKAAIEKENSTVCPASTSTIRYDSCSRSLTMDYSMPACGSTAPVPITRTIKYQQKTSEFTYQAPYNGGWRPNPPYSEQHVFTATFTVVEWGQSQSTTCDDPKFPNGPLKFDGKDFCFPLNEELPVTPEWLEEQIAKQPNPFYNNDIGLDDFVDWETGAPHPDLFDNPTFDPVSPTFADAAESIATGQVQHDNPNAEHYVPREMMPNLLVQINNWYEGNSFTDVFTGQQIKPDEPPKEQTPIDWSKFPGLTKGQYEQVNNQWGNAAAQGKDLRTEEQQLKDEQQKLTDFIESPPPAFSGQPILLDFVSLPTSGGCKGFTIPASIRGEQKSITVDQHCPPYNDWGQPVVSWLLSIYTMLLCFQIFRRTLEVSP